MDHSVVAWLAALVLGVTGPCLCASQAEVPAVAFGHKDYLESKILGERREILVDIPSVAAGVKVPLLVTLDGEFAFQPVATVVRHLTSAGRLPPMAVAGVVNTNRGRDMNPGFEGREFATSDAAARFLAFLCDELVPYMQQKYPVSGYRVLLGISNSGLFVTYSVAQKLDAFQGHVIISPAGGDQRIQPLVARALSKPGQGSHFLFLSMGDEEADIAVGTMRLAKTIEESASPSLAYHYEYFRGETHASVGIKAIYRALELLGEPDAVVQDGISSYMSESQHREQTWLRRFGNQYTVRGFSGGGPAPLASAIRPLLDCLAQSCREKLPEFWSRLRGEYGSNFRFDPVDLANLVAYLEAAGRKQEASALLQLPGFPAATKNSTLNNYGSGVDLKAGLAAHIVMDGGLRDLVNPATQFKVQGAATCPDRQSKENGAYRFNGRDSLVSITGNPALQAAGSLAVSTWIRPRVPTSYAAWISQVRSGGWGSKWRIGFGSSPASQWGATTLTTHWSDYWTDGAGIAPGQWVHVVAVFDQTLGSLRLYQDGKPVQEWYAVTPWVASTGPLLLGVQRDDGIYYDGDVGEVRIYNRTLNAAEVASLYAAP